MKKNIRLPEIEYKGNRFPVYLSEDELYSFGGWLKENVGNIVSTAAGVGAMFIPGAQGAGIGMIAGGMGGILGNAFAEEPETIDYSKETRMPRTVGKENMTPNVMSFQKGGKITKLDPNQEKTFQSWYKRTAKNLGLDNDPDNPMHYYDYRGYYKEFGDVLMENGQHFTDTYKLPGHPTFSNQSKYANFYNKDLQGYWDINDKYIPPKKYKDGGPINTIIPDILMNINLLKYSKDNLTNEVANTEIKNLWNKRSTAPVKKKKILEGTDIEEKALKLFKDTYGRDMNVYDQESLGLGRFRFTKTKKQNGGELQDKYKGLSTITTIRNNYRPVTMDQYFDAVSQYYPDMSLDSFKKYSPEEQMKLVPNDTFRVEIAKKSEQSMYPGNLKYFVNSPYVTGRYTYDKTGKAIPGVDMSKVKKEEFKKGGKVHKVMKEFKEGTLHSGSKKGPIVTDRDQAIAIALSEEKRKRKKKKAYGGEVDEMLGQSENLIDLTGMPTHEEGGIQFTPDAELEGGETVYKNIVNSDSIKITKEIADDYGLPKTAIGKSVSEYSKVVEGKYKDREMDPFAMKSRELELNNLAKMSMDLAKTYEEVSNIQGKSEDQSMMKYGGKMKYQYGSPEELTGWRKRVHDRSIEVQNRPKQSFLQELIDPLALAFGKDMFQEQIVPVVKTEPIRHMQAVNIYNEGFENVLTPEQAGYNESNNTPILNPVVTKPVAEETFDFQFQPGYNFTKKDAYLDYLKRDNAISPVSVPSTKTITGETEYVKPDTSKLQPYKGTPGKPIVGGKNNIDWANLGASALSAAPIAINAFMAAKTAKEGADKVKLGRIHAEEFNPELIDPEYQLSQVSDVFNTANQQIESQSKEDYLRRRIQSATEEAKSKSGVLGQVKQANAQMINQAKELNQRSAMQADVYNLQAQMQEEQINAGNKGAWQTARDYQLSSLGTMAGELGRDIRLEEANDTMNERYLNVLNEAIKQTGYTFNQEGNMSRIPNVVPSTSAMQGSDNVYGTKFTNPSYRQYDPADSVYPGINIQPGVNNTPGYNNYRYLMNMRMPNIDFNRKYTGKF